MSHLSLTAESAIIDSGSSNYSDKTYRDLIRNLAIPFVVVLSVVFNAHAQNVGRWVEQPTEVPVRGLMGISMADTGLGYATGDVDVIFNRTGVYRKVSGDPMWRPVHPSAFNPPLTIALTSWAQDVYAVPNTSIAFISWRDDYRSLVYKTVNSGQSWFNVSPINPILYGTRFAITFKDNREGMIAGEGPGRVHKTLDGGTVWQSYSIAANMPFTDVKFSGLYWNVVGGENAYFRYNPISDRWFDFSFPNFTEYFPQHAKLSFINDDYVYLSGYNSKSPNHIIVSKDGGKNWMPILQQPPFRTTPEGHKGIWFFDVFKGWAASDYNEFAYTGDGGLRWTMYPPQVFGGKTYRPVNKMIFINEAVGWAVGGVQRTTGYPSVSDGWIFKWEGTLRPDISATAPEVWFDTLSCGPFVDLEIPIVNSGSGTLLIPPGGANLTHPEFTILRPSFPMSVPAGGTRSITVRWEPSPGYFGPPPVGAALIVESSDDVHSPWRIGLNGLRRMARLSHSPSLIFPTVCVGELAVGVLRTTTIGNFPPLLMNVELFSQHGDMTLVNHNLGDTLSSPDSLVFHYRSDRSGPFSGSIAIQSGFSACPETGTVSFSGTMSSSELKALPAILDFGDVCVGATSTLFVALENVGTGPLTVLSSTLVQGNPAFSFKPDSALLINKGARAMLPVRFTPQRPDSSTTTTIFQVLSGPCADTVEVICRGRAVATVCTIAPDSVLRIGPAALGKTVTSQFLLENAGSLQSTITEISISPPVPNLTLTAPSVPFALNAQARLPVTVSWTASIADTIRSTVRLIADAPCRDTLTLLFELIGDEMPVIDAPQSLIFQTQTCDDPMLDSVRIGNDGQQPLIITDIKLGGSDSSHFSVIGPPVPISVPPGGAVHILMSYASPSNGVASASLRLRHNDKIAGGETVILLNARRKVQTLTVSGDTLSPILGCIGTIVTRRIILKNTNADPLQLLRLEQLQGAPLASVTHPLIPRSIAPNDSVILDLRVQLPADTLFDLVLRVTTDPCFEQRTITIPAGAWRPRLSIQPSPIDFGIRSVLDIARMTVTLRNDDSVVLAVDTVALRDTGGRMILLHSASYPHLLPPDSTMDLDLALAIPKDTGTVTGELCVLLTSPCRDTICTDVFAVFRPGALLLAPSPFISVLAHCDTVRCDTVIVTNPLTIPQTIRASVSPTAIFSLAAGMDEFSLPPGASIALVICSRLDARDQESGLLVLDATTGFAQLPLIALRDPGLLAIRDTLDAGNVPYCESSREAVLAIGNPGPLPRTIVSADVPAGAWAVITPLPPTLVPGASDTLRLRFTPQRVGEADPVTLRLRIRTRTCVKDHFVELRGRHAARYLDVTPNSLVFANVTLGNSQMRVLSVRNIDMRGLRLSAIRSSNPLFTIAASVPQVIDSGGLLSLPVTFQPTGLGAEFGSLCLIFDAPCRDTLCIGLEGTSVEGVLRFTPAVLEFDTLVQCESDTLSATIMNTGVTAVTLHGTTIGGPGVAAFSILNPVTIDEILNPGLSRVLVIRYAPALEADGRVAATLFVTSDATLQPVTELQLAGHRRTQMTSGTVPLPLGQVLQGALISRTVDIPNTGSSTVSVEGSQTPAGYAIDNQFPLDVPAAAFLRIALSIVPMRDGVFSDTVRLALGPCGGTIDIIVTGIAVRKFIVTDLHVGEVPFCRTVDGLVTVRNNSNAPARIDSLRIEGLHASRFSLVLPPPLPLWLASASEIQLAVRYMPAPQDRGGIEAALVVRVELEGGDALFSASLRAEVSSGELSGPDTVDLGAAPLGVATVITTVAFRNASGWPVRLDGATPLSSRVRVQGSANGSFAPGDSVVLSLSAVPDMPGQLVDTLVLRYSEPCAANDTVIVLSHGTGDVLPLRFEIGNYSGAPGDTIEIALRIDRDIDGFPVGDWTGTISFNPSMLYPLALRTEGTVSAAMTADFAFDNASGAIVIGATGKPSISSEGNLVILRCLVLIGDDIETPLTLSMMDFVHPVLYAEELSAGRFTLDGYCVDDGRRLVRERAGFWLGQSAPNPASTTVLLPFHLDAEARTSLKLYDANGREAGVVVESFLPSGRHEYRFDVRALPAGYYRCVLTSGSRMLSRGMHIVK